MQHLTLEALPHVVALFRFLSGQRDAVDGLVADAHPDAGSTSDTLAIDEDRSVGEMQEVAVDGG